MAANKAQENDASVQDYLDAIVPESRRLDCIEMHGIMHRITGCEAKMWGDGMVGFNRYHYKYESGREGDYFKTGFASRKQALTISSCRGTNPMTTCSPGSARISLENHACISNAWTISTGRSWNN